MESILDNIESPEDLKSLEGGDLILLAKEIRSKIIDVLSINGGHLSSNLGIVELTIALHTVFNSPIDKFIFDVSHQSYTHKLLTGRNKAFHTIRKYKGLCGFSHPKESPHDPFYLGHAGAALSLALGISKNRDLTHRKEHIIPIIGDGSLTNGLTLEALNNIPKDLKRFIVILNDNKMAISKNVGNIKNILSRILNSPKSNKIYQEIEKALSKIPSLGNKLARQSHVVTESIKNLVSSAPFFENLNLSYIGPIDGHDTKKLIETFKELKDFERPVLVHVITQKGKGLDHAIQDPTLYHGVKPFDILTGKFKSNSLKHTFPQIFGKHLHNMARADNNIIAINPAMMEGSCLSEFQKEYPNRCLDVGIAEGHAITFAGGTSYKNQLKVVANLYSTFLQRSFDNIFHDVCLQNNNVLFAIDRAGLSGPDGSTHHGIYDISFLNAMPNMTITQPRNGIVLKELLSSCFLWNRPVAIRYPNLPTEDSTLPVKERAFAKADILSEGKDLLILPLGHMFETAFEIKDLLKADDIRPTIVDPVFIKPLDKDLLYELLLSHKCVVTIEEHSLASGFGSIFNSFVIQNGLEHLQIINIGIPDTFVEHGSREQLLKDMEMDSLSIYKKILNRFDIKKKIKEKVKL